MRLPDAKFNMDDLTDELTSTVFTKNIFNGKDILASYMAMDQIGLCPEEFFNRNDRYGMAYSMEGRFPLATKKFMQYCVNIRTDIKIGPNSFFNNLKPIPRKAYRGLLPVEVTTKEKTGWTAPASFWAKQNMDNGLMKTTYDSIFSNTTHGIRGLEQGSKKMIPGMITSLWATKYNMHI